MDSAEALLVEMLLKTHWGNQTDIYRCALLENHNMKLENHNMNPFSSRIQENSMSTVQGFSKLEV